MVSVPMRFSAGPPLSWYAPEMTRPTGAPTRVAVLSTNRADYSTVRPILRAATGRSDIEMFLLAVGNHWRSDDRNRPPTLDADHEAAAYWGPLTSEHGSIDLSPEWLAAFTIWIHGRLAALRPDILLVIGDRFEVMPAATSALLLEIPIAHVSGGDMTLGAIDNQVRFALSMMSSIHFVSHESHARRLTAMGEASSTVHLVGEPALGDIPKAPQLKRSELFVRLGLRESDLLVLLTYHPPTIAREQWKGELESLVGALSDFPGALIITGANGDPQSREVNERLSAFAARHPNAAVVSSLGADLYYEVLHHASFMIGNSSSGIWEAPSVGLPVINIGERQAGRIRAANVMDSPADIEILRDLIGKALDPEMIRVAGNVSNPYFQPKSATQIVQLLAKTGQLEGLLRKQFPGAL